LNANEKAGLTLMLKNALLNQAEDKNNGKPLDDYDRAYLDGMIATLKTILENYSTDTQAETIKTLKEHNKTLRDCLATRNELIAEYEQRFTDLDAELH
jgi:hypothetical protein